MRIEDTLGVENEQSGTMDLFPSPDWILYSFFDILIDVALPQSNLLLKNVEDLDESIFNVVYKDLPSLLHKIEESRRVVISFRRELVSKQKVIQSLSEKAKRFVSSEVKVYFRDVLDHINVAMRNNAFAKEILFQTHSNFNSRTQIQVHEASKRSDFVMNFLQVITLIYIPFAVVAGCWGMNIRVPWHVSEETTGELVPFIVIVSILAFVSLMLVLSSIIGLKVLDIRKKRSQEI